MQAKNESMQEIKEHIEKQNGVKYTRSSNPKVFLLVPVRHHVVLCEGGAL